MKIVAISTPNDAREALEQSQRQGYITFIYHHADPSHELLRDKFLYVHTDEELTEKMALLRTDMTAQDQIQL